ncbi:MAG TPA: Ni/Fe hydrogenase subunit alpha [Bryobacteraceae bacterium]|nr:Ni/Fe hydrogenase subunit alpha [Bryobacteraceae bacterium]
MSRVIEPRKKNGTIRVDYMARVEGEGALFIKLKNDQVQDVKLKLFEPPRLFEALLRGRHFSEAPDITARICGICPVAYQMTAVHSIERALGITVHPMVRLLRRLLYAGEWIESHVLHMYMLHAPDFMGYRDFVELARDHPAEAREALRLKKLGNQIMTLLGGREIHPVSVAVGGFYKTPSKSELEPLADELKRALDIVFDKAKFLAGFDYPDFEQTYEFVALSHPSEYPLNEGRLVSSKGLNIDASQYEDYFTEHHVKHSNALHSVIRGRDCYQTGPLARFNLNYSKLPEVARQAAEHCGLRVPCLNPFKSILARAVEVVFALQESLRIIQIYEPPPVPRVPFEIRAAAGNAITEAPRGIQFNRYTFDEQGLIQSVKIVPPTSQNQKRIEEDLKNFVPGIVALPIEEITRRCEQAVRNYDPCISCATHFLKVTLERE